MPRFVVLAALLAVGCASAQPPTRSAAREIEVEVPAGASQPEGASAPVVVEPELLEVRAPAQLACRLELSRYQSPKLRLSAGGPVFATLRGIGAGVLFPVTRKAESSVVEANDARVVLRGHVASAELPIHLRAPFALSGFVYPAATTTLLWTSGRQGALGVELDVSRTLTWPPRVSSEISCESLSMSAGQYSVRDRFTKKARLPELNVLHDGAELALEPGAEPVAGLRKNLVAQVLETRGTDARVLIDAQSYALVGWVARAALGKGLGVGYGRLGRRHTVRRARYPSGRTCDHDLTLLAEVGGDRAKVGVLLAGGRFELLIQPTDEPETGLPPPRRSHEPRFRSVHLPEATWLYLEDSARLLMDDAELSTCAPPGG